MLPFTVLTAVVAAIGASATPLNKRGPVNLPITIQPKSAQNNRVAPYGTDISPNSPAPISPASPNGDPEANLTSWGADTLYTVSVSVGTPPKQVPVQMDTGSTLLWVKDKPPVDEYDEGTKYLSANSSSWKPSTDAQGQPLQGHLTYGKGEIWPFVGEETVSLGSQTIEHQQIGIARNWSSDLNYFPNEGIMGFAWPGPSSPKPFWQRLAETWADKSFGIYLKRAPLLVHNDEPSPGGVVTLGGSDPTYYNGDLHYTPRVVVPKLESHWTIPLDGIKFGDKNVITSGTPAIIDSGTTVVLGPPAEVAKIYANINGSRPINVKGGFVQYNFPCQAVLPNVSFTFGGVDYPISEQDFNWAAEGADCVGGIGGLTSIDFWVVGDTFLKNVYSSYRVEPPSIGFAPLKPEYNFRPDPTGPDPADLGE